MPVEHFTCVCFIFCQTQKRWYWWYVWSAERSGWLKDPNSARYGTYFGEDERPPNWYANCPSPNNALLYKQLCTYLQQY